MLPKITLVFDRKKNRKVEACVYYAGHRRYLSTGITVPKNASFRNGVISGCPTAPSLNKVLTTAMNILMGQLQAQVEDDKFDLSAYSLALAHNTDSFTNWAIARCDTMTLRKGTVIYYKNIIDRFGEKGIKNFDDITDLKIQRAVDALVKELSPTSLRAYHTIFMGFVRAARAERLISSVPAGATLPKGKPKGICYLTHEELTMVENMELTGRAADARDMFLFACYTGLAYSDLTKINKDDIVTVNGKPYIIDRRKKTDTMYRLRMLPKAQSILERHDFNLDIMGNRAANYELGKLEEKIKEQQKAPGKKAFRKHLSMHVGRHTFATLALSSGVRIETVSRMLAHSNIQTTQIYAKVLQKDVDEGFDILEGKI